jgi:hypothetical protein
LIPIFSLIRPYLYSNLPRVNVSGGLSADTR